MDRKMTGSGPENDRKYASDPKYTLAGPNQFNNFKRYTGVQNFYWDVEKRPEVFLEMDRKLSWSGPEV